MIGSFDKFILYHCFLQRENSFRDAPSSKKFLNDLYGFHLFENGKICQGKHERIRNTF